MNKYKIISTLLNKEVDAIDNTLEYVKKYYDASGIYVYEKKGLEFVCSFFNSTTLLWNTLKEEEVQLVFNNENSFLYSKSSLKLIDIYLDYFNINSLNLFVFKQVENGFIILTDCTNKIDEVFMTTLTNSIFNYLEIYKDSIQLKRDIIQLKQHRSLDKLLLQCSTNLLYSEDMNESVNDMLDIVLNYYKASRVMVFEYLETNDHATLTYEVYLENLNAIKKSYRFIEIEHNYWRDILFHYKGVYEHDDPTNLLYIMPFHDAHSNGFIVVLNPTINLKQFVLLKSIVLYLIKAFGNMQVMNRLKHLSYIDDITGLYNRNSYYDYLERLKRVPPLSMGVVFIDINDLKLLNDTLGHLYGDRLIIWTSAILKRYFNYRVYRIGGDEFVCFFENTTRQDFNYQIKLLQDFLNQFKTKYLSMGAIYETGFKDIEQLIHKADTLMYEDKLLHRSEYTTNKSKLIRILKKQLNELSNL